MVLVYDNDSPEPPRQPPQRAVRRRERMREVSTRIAHSRGVNARRRREAEAERTLARARQARMEAQKFREYVEKRHLRLMPPPEDQE